MIKENINRIKDKINEIKQSCGIDYEIALMAVSKTYPADMVREASDAGIKLFGENRILEAYDKFGSENIKSLGLDLHIIGHIQRNKAKEAVMIAGMVESIDKIDTLREISKHAVNQDKTIDYLIEINSSGEPQKYGINPDDLSKFYDMIANADLPGLRLRGLMTVGPLTDDKDAIREAFRHTKVLFDKMSSQLKSDSFDLLSMGMSGDYDIAIMEGSTQVRVGSAIFGNRSYL